MKKLMATTLAFVMLFSAMTACSSDDSGTNEEAPKTEGTATVENSEAITESSKAEDPADKNNAEISSDKFDFVSCRFAEEVRAKDGELAATLYRDIEKKIYVDTVLEIGPPDSEITENDFSGYLTYDDTRYDLQYCVEGASCVSVNTDAVPASGGRVHLFTSLPKEAEGEDLTVYFKAFGEEFNCKVEAKDTSDPMESKTLLKAGDRQTTYNGDVEFEVLSSKSTKTLHATDYENSEQYSGSGIYFDVVLKITNNMSEQPIFDEYEYIITTRDIYGYTIKDGEAVATGDRGETNNNTELDSFWEIKPGSTNIVHLIASFDEGEDISDVALRFNFGGNLYYCYPE